METAEKDTGFFTHKEITLDYYQVLIARKRPSWCKVIWFLVASLCLGFTVVLVYKLVHSYLQYNSYNVYEEKWVTKVALPALTICNVNTANYTLWQNKLSDQELHDAIYFAKILSWYKGGTGSNATEALMTKVTSQGLLDQLSGVNVNFLKDFLLDPNYFIVGHGIEHPLYEADVTGWEFANNWYEMADAGFITTSELGNCISLNDNQFMIQRWGGTMGGFTVDLDTRLYEYIPSTKTKGFMLYLRNPNETLAIDKGGIHLSPGQEIFVELEKQKIERLPLPYGTCEDNPSMYRPEIMQTVRECLQKDLLDSVLDVCGCIPWYYEDKLLQYNESVGVTDWVQQNLNVTWSDTVCSFVEQSLCDLQILIAQSSENYTSTDVKCPEPCNYVNWEYNINSVQFPATEDYYTTFLYEGYLETYSSSSSGIDLNFTYARDNFIRLHVYYDDIKITNIEQEKAYELYNFIAEFGGSTDLLIGFSLFTLFQLGELLIGALIIKCCSKRNKVEETWAESRTKGEGSV